MIILVPIGFSAEHELERMRALLEARFSVRTYISPTDLDPRPFLEPKRHQYYSSAILEQLERDVPQEDAKVLGVCSLDLYIPILTFVFGEAQLNGRCAVISSYRLDNKFYGLPEDPEGLQERLYKEAIHELGHTFGLVHCQDQGCVMRSSTYMEEIDWKSNEFCPDCMARIAPLF